MSLWDEWTFEAQQAAASVRSLRPALSAKEARPFAAPAQQQQEGQWERSASASEPRRYVSPFQLARLQLQMLHSDTDGESEVTGGVGSYGRDPPKPGECHLTPNRKLNGCLLSSFIA